MIAKLNIPADRRATLRALAAFAFMLTVPHAVEFPLLGLMSFMGLLKIKTFRKSYVSSVFMVITVFLLTNLFIYGSQDYPIDYYAMTAECKLLTVFFIPVFLYRNFLLSDGIYRDARPLLFYNFFIPAIFISTLIGAILGSPRDSLIFGFSINAAYAILYLSAYLLEKISLRMLLLAVVAVGLLGSTMAAMLMAILILLRYKKYWIFSPLILAALLTLFYFYSIEFRGKDFLHTDISGFDRYQINMFIGKIVATHFDLINYILGWGMGRALPPMDPGNFDVISGWFLHDFTANGAGIFSSTTHNEYMRIFLDYGIVGLIALCAFIYKFFPIRVSVFLALAAITNTTLFSTSNILVLSLIVADYHARLRHFKSSLSLNTGKRN